jgi:hypothetical protein
VRGIEEKVKVRQIIVPLLQFNIHILFAEAMTRKKTNKNLPIKAILTAQLFEEKQLTIISHKKTTTILKIKINWVRLSKGWE